MVIAFVDDSDFFTSGIDSERKMNEIMKMHVDLHEATGGKIQFEKVVMFSFKWTNGVIMNNDEVAKIGDHIIKRLETNESIKTLGVHINPKLTWENDFFYAKRKLEISVQKLMGTTMEVYQVRMCFNTCVLTNVCH